jgi:iron complex transport system ATP-binding protein
MDRTYQASKQGFHLRVTRSAVGFYNGWVTSLPLIELENVTVQRGPRVALDRVTLSIAQGEHVAILGPNGSGKSTLMKLISRDLYPRQTAEPWSLRILGSESWDLFELRNRIGLVSNDWMQMCTRSFSGLEIVLSGFFGSVGIWPYHDVTREMEATAREAMETLEIAHLAERSTDHMSSGEARRFLIARALVHGPQALMLDEPTTSLDLRATDELRQMLSKLARRGIGIIMVTHHLPDIIPEIERVVTIRGGRIVRDGAKREVLEAGALSELFGLRVEVLKRGGYYHVL